MKLGTGAAEATVLRVHHPSERCVWVLSRLPGMTGVLDEPLSTDKPCDPKIIFKQSGPVTSPTKQEL